MIVCCPSRLLSGFIVAVNGVRAPARSAEDRAVHIVTDRVSLLLRAIRIQGAAISPSRLYYLMRVKRKAVSEDTAPIKGGGPCYFFVLATEMARANSEVMNLSKFNSTAGSL